MVKFLIATHGFLADGFKSSINVLMGEEIANSIMTINAFVENGEMNPKGRIQEIVTNLKDEDDLVIFSDLMYGSVNQFALPYIDKENVHIITGINFPVICEIISKLTFSPQDDDLSNIIEDTVEKAKEQLIYVKKVKIEENNEETFFE